MLASFCLAALTPLCVLFFFVSSWNSKLDAYLYFLLLTFLRYSSRGEESMPFSFSSLLLNQSQDTLIWIFRLAQTTLYSKSTRLNEKTRSEKTVFLFSVRYISLWDYRTRENISDMGFNNPHNGLISTARQNPTQVRRNQSENRCCGIRVLFTNPIILLLLSSLGSQLGGCLFFFFFLW